MPSPRFLIALPLVAALTACVSPDPASRAAVVVSPQQPASVGHDAVAPRKVLKAQYDVRQVAISVPRDLRVSEANVFYPIADVVWRGEPRGDRYAQVERIFQEAAAEASGPMTHGRAVNVVIEVTRFHCLTEKTRYTVGGTHALHFTLTVTDAATGQVIDGPRAVVADIKASGGAQAIAEDQMGQTQRVVVVARLAEVIRRELSAQVTDPGLVTQALTPAPVLVTAQR